MQTILRGFIGAYVKVEVVSRSPKRWGWAICAEGFDVVVERSGERFQHAEDAWKAGQSALGRIEPKRLSQFAA
jgi:hypothetical protein